MTSAYQRGVFRSDPPPLHVGRKANRECAEKRSQSDEAFGRKNKIDCTATRDHLVVGRSPCIERPEAKPMKHHVNGHESNKSRCPWDVSQLSARKVKGRKMVDTSDYNKARRHGKGPGLHPEFAGDRAANFVVPNRDGNQGMNRRRVNPQKAAESTPETEFLWKPSRRHLENSRSSQSAEYNAPKKYQHRRNSATSLWGPPDAVRSASAEPRRSPTRSPLASSFDLAHCERTVPVIKPLDVKKATCPFDNTYHREGAAKEDVGKRTEFRPRTRVFSATNTRANIFGF